MGEMADFDVESVARTNKLDKVKLDILNRRQETINAYKLYMKYQSSGHFQKGLAEFRNELGALFIEVKQMVSKEIKNESTKLKQYKDIQEIKEDIESEQPWKVEKAWDYIDSLLYKKRITAIDTRETTDTRDIIEMNKKGYY